MQFSHPPARREHAPSSRVAVTRRRSLLARSAGTLRRLASLALPALPVVLTATLMALPSLSFAQTAGLPAFNTSPGPNGGTTYSLSVQTMLLLTMLSFLPAMVLMMTSFTRIIIVLSLLRQALGTTTTPPNQVLVGLALFLTLFIMSPVLDKAYNDGYKPFSDGSMPMEQAVTRGLAPFKTFMLRQTRETDLALFARISHAPPMQGPEDVPLPLLVPAFVTSELKTGFQIGFTIFIPFLIIDMVVASVLMSMGMMMVSDRKSTRLNSSHRR